MSSPLAPGSMRSSSTRSNDPRSRWSSASVPEYARVGSCPARAMILASRALMSGSSSTMRMLLASTPAHPPSRAPSAHPSARALRTCPDAGSVSIINENRRAVEARRTHARAQAPPAFCRPPALSQQGCAAQTADLLPSRRRWLFRFKTGEAEGKRGIFPPLGGAAEGQTRGASAAGSADDGRKPCPQAASGRAAPSSPAPFRCAFDVS